MIKMRRIFVTVVVALLTPAALYGAWLLIRVFVMDTFIIPSTSMLPVLKPGDRVVVDKTIMGARLYTDFDFNPEGGTLRCWRTRGVRSVRVNDIVVFNYPRHKKRISFVINHVYCKRCIALPGDSISIVQGYYVNNNHAGVLGHKESQDNLATMADSVAVGSKTYRLSYYKHLSWTVLDFGPLYVPREGDMVSITPREACMYKPILEWETGRKVSYNMKTGKVWADSTELTSHRFMHNYYFMAGDNVLDSSDSRYWGLVPEEYIVGIVTYILTI